MGSPTQPLLTRFLKWRYKHISHKTFVQLMSVVIGLLVGYILGVALSAFIDMGWFPERGHYVHRY